MVRANELEFSRRDEPLYLPSGEAGASACGQLVVRGRVAGKLWLDEIRRRLALEFARWVQWVLREPEECGELIHAVVDGARAPHGVTKLTIGWGEMSWKSSSFPCGRVLA